MTTRPSWPSGPTCTPPGAGANWLAEHGYDIEPAEVRAHHVDEFIADWIAATSPAYGAYRYRNLWVFLSWLVKHGELSSNPMAQTEPPNVPEKITALLTDEELVGTSARDTRTRAVTWAIERGHGTPASPRLTPDRLAIAHT